MRITNCFNFKNCNLKSKSSQTTSFLFKWQPTDVQINEYKTGPYFLQSSQKLTSDSCYLLISVFLPVFTIFCMMWSDHNIVLEIKTKQFYDHIMQKLVKAGKNTEINKQYNVNFLLNSVNWIKLGAVSYLLSCNQLVLTKHKVFLAGFKVVITVVQNDSSVIND